MFSSWGKDIKLIFFSWDERGAAGRRGANKERKSINNPWIGAYNWKRERGKTFSPESEYPEGKTRCLSAQAGRRMDEILSFRKIFHPSGAAASSQGVLPPELGFKRVKCDFFCALMIEYFTVIDFQI